MRNTVIALAGSLLLLVSSALATDDSAEALHGVWRLTSFKFQVIGEDAAPREPFGPNPKGWLILMPEGRMMAVITASDRKPPTNDAESAALLKSMIAYTGRYTVEGDRFVTKVDAAWNEVYMGHDQVRLFTVDGDTLTIKTLPQPSGVAPGKIAQGFLTWVRER